MTSKVIKHQTYQERQFQNSDQGPTVLQSADEKNHEHMLRSGKDQNNERSESNSTLWYNFPLDYSQVLQVVSTFRAGSTVPTSRLVYCQNELCVREYLLYSIRLELYFCFKFVLVRLFIVILK